MDLQILCFVLIPFQNRNEKASIVECIYAIAVVKYIVKCPSIMLSVNYLHHVFIKSPLVNPLSAIKVACRFLLISGHKCRNKL